MNEMNKLQVENCTYTDFVIVHTTPQSRLWLCSGFSIELRHPCPNKWHRMWHRIFFGFRWETLAEEK